MLKHVPRVMNSLALALRFQPGPLNLLIKYDVPHSLKPYHRYKHPSVLFIPLYSLFFVTICITILHDYQRNRFQTVITQMDSLKNHHSGPSFLVEHIMTAGLPQVLLSISPVQFASVLTVGMPATSNKYDHYCSHYE